MRRVALLVVAAGALTGAVIWAQTNVTVGGDVAADAFVGDGSQLTGLDAPGTDLDTRISNAEILLLALENQVTASSATVRSDLLCRTGAVRYLDLGDGTVFDCQQRLQWLKDATCLGNRFWSDVVNTVLPDFNDGTSTASCTDYTSGTYNDWRLPTKSEWEDAASDANDLGCTQPNLTSDLGARLVDDLPVDGVTGWVGTCGTDENLSFTLPVNKTWTFYSASEDASDPNKVWIFGLGSGNLNNYTNDSLRHVWAVRGGN